MDDEKIRQHFQANGERLLELAHETTNLRASVNALKVALAALINPVDPLSVLETLRQTEEVFLERDPQAQKLAQAEQMMEAVKLWQKHGSQRSQS